MDRIVVDTNVFVSAVVVPDSIPRQAVDKALDQGLVLFSESTMHELEAVLSRVNFDHYARREERELFLSQLERVTEFVPTIQLIRECRDPKDDKFLEVAINGRADVIVTGDRDLLVLHPWRDVAVLSPRDYLKR